VLVVLDTGIYVSAAISPAGTARRVVQAGIEGRFDYAVCPTLLAELDDVLARPKIARLLPPDAAGRFVADVRGRARVEPDPAQPRRMTRDPKDDYLVALASAVRADRIVTGDADLLDLQDPPVVVVSLRSFADVLDAT
jgi:putative PIN family toxin of toxin-antitoxin system